MAESEIQTIEPKEEKEKFIPLFVTWMALGIVFGDIGTSPLYAMDAAAARATRIELHSAMMGIASLIFWTLILVVLVKYLFFVLRADNDGEGGIFALQALLDKHFSHKHRLPLIFLLIALGAALFIGDGVITPSISILSAVEGVNVIDPGFTHYVVPITVLILILLFVFQRFISTDVGPLFATTMCLWFLLLGGMGVYQLWVSGTHILNALDPMYAVNFLWTQKYEAFKVLGAVILCVTGVEALYADLGRFTRRSITLAWLFVVMPALILNYMGQGALILHSKHVPQHIFFHMLPKGWLTIALIVCAIVATVIASQAIIVGMFALTRQAIQLKYLPNYRIIHTSDDLEAHIYIPAVNFFLGFACIMTVEIFKNSQSLAAVYGIAVTGTMAITSIAYFLVRWRHWKKSIWISLLLVAVFLTIDLAFFSANIIKIDSGGIFPLIIAGAGFCINDNVATGALICKTELAIKA